MAIVVSSPTFAEHVQTSRDLVFGVFPAMTADNIMTAFSELTRELSRELEQPVILQTATSFVEFDRRLEHGDFDLIYVQPISYVKTASKNGYRPLVSVVGDLRAVLVLQSGANETTLAELSGKHIGTPPDQATITYLLRYALAQQPDGLTDTIQFTEFQNHELCLQVLLIGQIDSCATSAIQLGLFGVRNDVVLPTFTLKFGVPFPTFAVHARVAAATREKLHAVLLRQPSYPFAPGVRTQQRLIDDQAFDIVRTVVRTVESLPSPTANGRIRE
ncbi:MAG: ABC-type phosphate/phosphonate transport system substrate-binding protein [Gammaproteobacteria bacterium]|jgi:ABC-type phosphate/phosphonate transport system substrate-binding protein